MKNHIWVFVNALIENPSFDSQTKENMTLQTKSFGSKCPLSDKFIRAVRTRPLQVQQLDAGGGSDAVCVSPAGHQLRDRGEHPQLG